MTTFNVLKNKLTDYDLKWRPFVKVFVNVYFSRFRNRQMIYPEIRPNLELREGGLCRRLCVCVLKKDVFFRI